MQVVIFDTETTGLIANTSMPLGQQPYITELYAGTYDLATGEMIGPELEFLCRVPVKLDAKVVQLTGIDDDLLAPEQPFLRYHEQTRDFFNEAPGILAHNLWFDTHMVDIELERLGTAPVKWPKLQIDTVIESMWYQSKRLKMSDLHLHLFGEKFKEAHRAKPDVEATARVATEMFKRGDL